MTSLLSLAGVLFNRKREGHGVFESKLYFVYDSVQAMLPVEICVSLLGIPRNQFDVVSPLSRTISATLSEAPLLLLTPKGLPPTNVPFKVRTLGLQDGLRTAEFLVGRDETLRKYSVEGCTKLFADV